MRQLLQNETENSYQKFVTKCDRGLLKNASGIPKCDRLLLESALGITKCGSYYKVGRNNTALQCPGIQYTIIILENQANYPS